MTSKIDLVFRGIVAYSTLLFIFLWLIPFLDLNLTQDEIAILDWYGYKSQIPDSSVIDWGLFLVWLFLSIGIFFYNNFSRWCFLLLIVATSFCSLIWGYRVYTPLESMLTSQVAMFDGAIIAIMYLTEVRNKFK